MFTDYAPNRLFAVDVLDSSLNPTGPGPIAEAISVVIEDALDEIGTITVNVPATYQRAADLVGAAVPIRVKLFGDGVVAYGRIEEIVKTLGVPQQTMALVGPRMLNELTFYSTQSGREYNNVATATIIGTDASGTGLLRSTGWAQGTVSPTITPTTITYESQTILQALRTLAAQTGDHFRQTSLGTRTLDWGPFGVSSGLRFTNVEQVRYAQATNRDLVYIGSLTENYISRDIQNRVYPLGASKFDLRDATAAATTIDVVASRGPLGASTLLVGAHGIGTTVWNVTAGTGTNFTVGQEIWIGTANTWTNNHEILTIQAVAANTITTTAGSANAYTGGEDAVQGFQFYVEDSGAQAAPIGLREAVVPFSWIKPIDDTALADRQAAADVLWNAASAHLTRYKEPYSNYVINEAYGVPASLRPGDKIEVNFKGGIFAYGVSFYTEISGEFYVRRISRTYNADGTVMASLEITNVDRPAPNNADLILFNLETNQWVGVR